MLTMRLTIFSVILFLVILIVPSSAFAQQLDEPDTGDGSGLKVSPALFEAVIEPGQTIEREFYIIHTTDQPLPIEVKPRPIDPIERIIDTSKIARFNAASWVTIDEPYHILENQETLRLSATITAPESAEPGGHYFMISVDALQAVSSEARPGVSVTPRIGILVFLTVPGPVVRDIIVTEDRFSPFIATDEIVRLTPSFKNTGTIHLMQNSKVVVENIFGAKKAEIRLPPRIVLPNTIKQIASTWEDVPIIGFYRMKINGTYGPGQKRLNERQEFLIAFRWLPLLLVLLPLGLIGWVVYRTRGRWGEAYEALRGN